MVEIKVSVSVILAAAAVPAPPIATRAGSLSTDSNEHLPFEDDRTPLLHDKSHAPPRPTTTTSHEKSLFVKGVKRVSNVINLFASPHNGYTRLPPKPNSSTE